MNISTMRFVDRWAGVPVCFALTLCRKIGDGWRWLLRRQPGKVRRIVFVKLAEQGATVLAWSALKKAVDRVGRDNVFFLVFQENRFILDVMEVIPDQNVLAIRTDSPGRLICDTLRSLWRLRKLGVDAAVDFEFFARSSAVLTYLSGAKRRVGLHSFTGEGPYRGDLMTHRVGYNPHLHTSQTFQVMVDALDCDPKDLPAMDIDPPVVQGAGATFHPSAEQLEQFREKIAQAAGTSEFCPLVLLNANASDLLPIRRWPPERYVELARRLLDRSDRIHIAFTGAPGEAAHVEAILRQLNDDRCFSLAGKTTLRELLVLYCLADVMVTNDSGPALFATLTPMNVVTLFGPETPALFGGTVATSNIVWKNLPCSPCVSAYNNRLSACRNNVCMNNITVDEVFDLVCRVCQL